MTLLTFPPTAAQRVGVPAASALRHPTYGRVLPRFLCQQCDVCRRWRVLDTLLGAQVGEWAATREEAVYPISKMLDRWMALVSEGRAVQVEEAYQRELEVRG